MTARNDYFLCGIFIANWKALCLRLRAREFRFDYLWRWPVCRAKDLNFTLQISIAVTALSSDLSRLILLRQKLHSNDSIYTKQLKYFLSICSHVNVSFSSSNISALLCVARSRNNLLPFLPQLDRVSRDVRSSRALFVFLLLLCAIVDLWKCMFWMSKWLFYANSKSINGNINLDLRDKNVKVQLEISHNKY